MKVIVHDVTPEGLKKLEELLQQPQHSHIQVQRTELDGVEQPKIVFDIADHREIEAGDIVILLAEHSRGISIGE